MGIITDKFKQYAKWGATNFMNAFDVRAYDIVTREGIQSHLHDIRIKTGVAIEELEEDIRLLKSKGTFKGHYDTEQQIFDIPNPKLGDFAYLKVSVNPSVNQEYIYDAIWIKLGQVGAIVSLDYASDVEASAGSSRVKIMNPATTKIVLDNGLTTKLDKGSGLKATSARKLEEQIENLFDKAYATFSNNFSEFNKIVGSGNRQDYTFTIQNSGAYNVGGFKFKGSSGGASGLFYVKVNGVIKASSYYVPGTSAVINFSMRLSIGDKVRFLPNDSAGSEFSYTIHRL